jgi:hypothetical protein
MFESSLEEKYEVLEGSHFGQKYTQSSERGKTHHSLQKVGIYTETQDTSQDITEIE